MLSELGGDIARAMQNPHDDQGIADDPVIDHIAFVEMRP